MCEAERRSMEMSGLKENRFARRFGSLFAAGWVGLGLGACGAPSGRLDAASDQGGTSVHFAGSGGSWDGSVGAGGEDVDTSGSGGGAGKRTMRPDAGVGGMRAAGGNVGASGARVGASAGDSRLWDAGGEDRRSTGGTLSAGGNNRQGGGGADIANHDVDSGGPISETECSTGGVVVPSGYKLVWSDEFSTEGRPNPDDWGYETGFVRNEEDQWYQPDNATVEGGCLVIEGREERKANPNYQAGSSDWKRSRQYAEYTSSSLRTMNKRSWQYGRFEMRGRIRTETGLWPAWWTLGVSGEWPSCGEIDIMEYYANCVRANVACGTGKQWQAKWDSVAWQMSRFKDENWQSEFHVWRMDWDEQKIDLLLDDELVNTSKLDDMLNADGKSPFRQRHYMILNLALGGTNGGDPARASYPSRFEVDYVRVFQKQ